MQKIFKRNNIRSVFNLEEKNEHSHCCEGILTETGFSYNPYDLIRDGSIF